VIFSTVPALAAMLLNVNVESVLRRSTKLVAILRSPWGATKSQVSIS